MLFYLFLCLLIFNDIFRDYGVIGIDFHLLEAKKEIILWSCRGGAVLKGWGKKSK
jgi:hypothetical protein